MYKKRKNYLNKTDLLAEILAGKERLTQDKTPAECISRDFALMLTKLVDNYAKRRNWAAYTWLEDWKCDALLVLCRNWHKFDETRLDRHGRVNPFAYYTQIIHWSFLTSMESEKKLRKIRDEIQIWHGLDPSWSAQEKEQTSGLSEQDREDARAG